MNCGLPPQEQGQPALYRGHNFFTFPRPCGKNKRDCGKLVDMCGKTVRKLDLLI